MLETAPKVIGNVWPMRAPPAHPDPGPFGELHAEREQLQAQLDALAEIVPEAADTSLLELPLAGDILTGLPDDLKVRLLDAFDPQILWNKSGQQATVHADITGATLRAPRSSRP
jgi:hypothetical protein